MRRLIHKRKTHNAYHDIQPTNKTHSAHVSQRDNSVGRGNTVHHPKNVFSPDNNETNLDKLKSRLSNINLNKEKKKYVKI